MMDAAAIAATRPDYLWHVALTHPGQDRQAAEALRNRKYRVYWPNFSLAHRVRASGRRTVIRSVFPGYLFVLPHRMGWELLHESPGLRGLMMLNERFVTMRDDDRDFRRIEEIEREMRQEPKQSMRFRVGQRVKVTKGNFAEIWGNVEGLDERGRVDVLIEMFKRKIPVCLSQDQLNPA